MNFLKTEDLSLVKKPVYSNSPLVVGIPDWLEKLKDSIYASLEPKLAPTFESYFLEAIPVGVNLENVKWCLALIRHKRHLVILEDNNRNYAIACKLAIQHVINYCESMINNVHDTKDQSHSSQSGISAKLARAEAESASRLAKLISVSKQSKEYLAYKLATSAARTARSAHSSECVVWSARWSAGHSFKEWELEAETLLKLISACK